MNPIIGIVMRKSVTESNKQISIIYKDIITAIHNSGGIPIGIPNNDITPYLNICHGFIFQGGDDIDDANLNILKTLHKNNIPVLAICLGMQEMAYLSDATIYDIKNHKITGTHEILINNKSKLHSIINKDKIKVNSRHKSAVKNPNLLITSISKDNVIESIEDPKKRFYIGLQWHPENTYMIDQESKKIFDNFIKVCKDSTR